MMWWHDGGIGWGGWLVMSVMMVTFWTLLAFGAVALWKMVSRGDRVSGDRAADARSEAERLLDERFARGEIDVDDYNERRELLRSSR